MAVESTDRCRLAAARDALGVADLEESLWWIERQVLIPEPPEQ